MSVGPVAAPVYGGVTNIPFTIANPSTNGAVNVTAVTAKVLTTSNPATCHPSWFKVTQGSVVKGTSVGASTVVEGFPTSIPPGAVWSDNGPAPYALSMPTYNVDHSACIGQTVTVEVDAPISSLAKDVILNVS